MIYSIWNYATKTYDYYQGGAPTGTHAGTPPSSMMSPQMGVTPEEASWRLPVGARKVGSGTTARGRIASLGDVGGLPSYAVPVAIGIGILYLWSKNR